MIELVKEAIKAKIEARKLAQENARLMIETAENMQGVVHMEVGRVMTEELGQALSTIHEAQRLIEANPRKNPRRFIINTLVKIENRLSGLSAAYASGALPRRKR
jgi:hypothetical protein